MSLQLKKTRFFRLFEEAFVFDFWTRKKCYFESSVKAVKFHRIQGTEFISYSFAKFITQTSCIQFLKNGRFMAFRTPFFQNGPFHWPKIITLYNGFCTAAPPIKQINCIVQCVSK